jgi:predicted transcriptional regulator YdeE
MSEKEKGPTIMTMEAPIYALGAGMATSDKAIMKDAATLGKRFAELRRRAGFGALRPRLFVAATSGYDEASGKYRYAMGDAVGSLDGAPPELERITVPSGTYAAFVVRPIFGFLWGPAIGRTYAFAYRRWLPSSVWRHDPRDSGDGKRIDHFEYHDERAARKKHPEMEIRIPIAPRES